MGCRGKASLESTNSDDYSISSKSFKKSTVTKM